MVIFPSERLCANSRELNMGVLIALSAIVSFFLVFLLVATESKNKNSPPSKALVGALVVLCLFIFNILAMPAIYNNTNGCPSGTNWWTGLLRNAPYVVLSSTKQGDYTYALVHLKTDTDKLVIQCVAVSEALPKLFSVGGGGSIVSLENAAQR